VVILIGADTFGHAPDRESNYYKNPAFDPCRVFSCPVLLLYAGPVAAMEKYHWCLTGRGSMFSRVIIKVRYYIISFLYDLAIGSSFARFPLGSDDITSKKTTCRNTAI
jgi:hypothetical protein